MRRSLALGLAGLFIVLLALGLNFWINGLPGSDDSEPSETAALAPDTATPKAPPILPAPEKLPATNPAQPGFDIVRVNPKGDAVIAGHAAPDATVTVLDGARIVGTANADHGGDWILVPSEPLGAGSRELGLSEKTSDGAVTTSDQSVVLVVPSGKNAGGDGAPLALLVPRNGPGASTLLQAPSDSQSSPPPLSQASLGAPHPASPATGEVGLDIIDYGDSGQLALTGHALPGAALRVYLDNKLLGSTDAAHDGKWRLEPDGAVAPGLYHLRVDELGASGQVVRRIELPFARASVSPELLAQDRLIVQPGSSLWRIARQAYGDGVRYAVIYEANRERIRDPDLIYPGQILSVPTASSPDAPR